MSITFSELVKSNCGKSVLKIENTHAILEILSKGLNSIISKSKYTRYEDRRINDLGIALEKEIKEIINNHNDVELMPFSQHMGYPDLRLKIQNDIVFIEIKTTSKDESFNSTQRVFYYSNGNKISDDGYHLLIQLFLESTTNNPNSYIFKKWKIKDLFSLKVDLKSEYNASYKDVNELPVLCNS